MHLSVIMTALNEEKNVELAVANVLQAFDDFEIEGDIVFINDGSTDNTEKIVKELVEKDPRICLERHDRPRGVGASFWHGVDLAEGDVVVWFPSDNENDPWEILRYYRLLEHVDMVIPFVFNKEARVRFRNVLSFIYRLIVNTTFVVNFNYTNGTIMYRKSMLQRLRHKSSGFFFQTDILIRSVKKGYLFAEVPYRLGMRSDGLSKAVSFPSFVQVAKGYFRLIKDIYFNKKEKGLIKIFPLDSLTFRRRKEDPDENLSDRDKGAQIHGE